MNSDSENLRTKYLSKLEDYNSLGNNLVDSIKSVLKSKEVKFLTITFRVKEVDSFLEKIERKGYENPFDDIEDICGVRIICYFKNDVEQIVELLKNELKIHESENKLEKLGIDQFGYRSHHLIASIKSDWTSVPNYRSLDKLKCEIQIRTVLMHAWAEIEHGLSYKSSSQAPASIQRELNLLSAQLETADNQFQNIKLKSKEYQKEILKKMNSDSFSGELENELNLDSLQVFMDTNYPERKQSLSQTSELLSQLIKYNINLKNLNDAWLKLKPHLKSIEKEYFKDSKQYSKWVQIGIARVSLDLMFDRFFERTISAKSKERKLEIRKKYYT